MTRPVVLVLPLPPNLANGRLAKAHWRTKDRARDQYRVKASWALVTQVGPVRRPRSAGRMQLAVRFYVWSLMDRDNLMARAKWPVDSLRFHGLIRDDSPAWLDWVGIPEQAVDRKWPRVEITLTEVEAVTRTDAPASWTNTRGR